MNSLLLASSALLAVVIIWRALTFKRKLSLPPGPKGWPVIGNLLDMPRQTTWLTFAEWGRTYGDISSVTVLGQPIIVLNSAKVAFEMLGKKSNTYSDRPRLPMGGELIGWKNTLPLVRYGDTFSHYRKLFHQSFGSHAAMKQNHELEEAAVHKFLQNLVVNPDDLNTHIRQYIGTIALRVVYGYDVKDSEDPFIHLVDHGMKQFAIATAPGSFLVDLVPSLQYVPSWFPGGGFHEKAKAWARDLAAMGGQPFEYAKKQFTSGASQRCFTSANLTSDVKPQDEHVIKWTASSVAAGGFSTRMAFSKAFFLTMTLFPEAQKKAQAELDTVVGRDRLPLFSDRNNLPYLNALCKEILRFHSIVPTGLPHATSEEDVHGGYLIPKGSLVFANIWNMLHDPEVYSKPDTFNPSRFMKSAGTEPETDIYDFIFGFGRRVCPGRFIADNTAFILAATVLSVFDIFKAVDKDGVAIEPVVNALSGSVSQPSPFSCKIIPRSADALALISSDD